MDTLLSRRATGWYPTASEPESNTPSVPRALKVICAWCTKVMANPEAVAVSHGICESCQADWKKEAGL